ncbi:hypothetical protein AVEN_178485-1 [Araneus ventricosus]|uniref:Uncharacterized protein n=1 Tax=Araneus ventricosus TaxID=182803 RepID=A0A4Y2CDQ4_ARAVE|nr:hypothetical protein AVEN_178485-1 [Araneus ventricosus]
MVNTLFVELAQLRLKPISNSVHDSAVRVKRQPFNAFFRKPRCESHMVENRGYMAGVPTLSTQTSSTCSVCEWPYVAAHCHGAKPLQSTTDQAAWP